jgi:limonene-1,2-epoxide hydrolase
MTAHRERVEAFFDSWSDGFDAVIASLDELLADDARWEQSALPTTTTKAEAIGLMHGFRAQLGLASIDVDMVNIADSDGVVITERVDHLRADDGSLIASFPVMGSLEFDERGRVSTWREIFDPRAALELLAAPNDKAGDEHHGTRQHA